METVLAIVGILAAFGTVLWAGFTGSDKISLFIIIFISAWIIATLSFIILYDEGDEENEPNIFIVNTNQIRK